MLVPKFTEEYREELLELGRQRLYFFEKALLGFKDMNDSFHVDWCDNLQGIGEWGKWRRGVLTAFRGAFKSTIGTIGFPLWCGLYPEATGLDVKDHSTRILAASYENGVRNFILPMQELFRRSRQADFLFWLFRHRIPEHFDGWTENAVRFVKFEPTSQDAITLKGMFAAQEGYHGNLILLDDPEGADAEGSLTPNADARRAVNLATPLLQRVKRDRILAVVTPHGDDPVLFRGLREDFSEEKPDRDKPIEWDNSKRVWKQIYLPVMDENGTPSWPELIDHEDIKMIRATVDRRTWDQQFMLRESSAGGGPFDTHAIEESFYEWWSKDKKIIGVKYPIRVVDKDLWEKEHRWVETKEKRFAKFEEMRFTLHSDLIHREDTVSTKQSGGKRPSQAAFIICATTPDFHVFVLQAFTAKVSLDEQVRLAFKFHREYGCHAATWDSVGAQVWFKKFIEDKERSNPVFRKLRSSGKYGESRLLPRLSTILVEDKRSVRMHKEDVIYERLGGWFSDGTLHLHPDQEELLRQIRTSIDSSELIDLLDALAQGPVVWKAPPPRGDYIRWKRRDLLQRSARDKVTGYWRPFHDRMPKVPDLEPPGGYGFDIKSRVN